MVTRLVPAALLALLLSAPAASHAQDSSAVRVTDEGIAFDFQDVDLRMVITALAEAGGLNIVYGALPQVPITLRTNQSIPREEVRRLLENIVEANGLRIVDQGSLLRIEVAGSDARPEPSTPTAQQSAGAERRLFVYRLKHAEATRLAGTLQALFGGGPASGQASRTGPLGLSQELRAQQVPFVVPEAARAQTAPGAPAQQSFPGQVSGEVQIVPEESTNSLLVRCSEADWPTIQQAIEALDLRPLQVLIEVLIAEVRRTRNFNLGISGAVPRQRDSETELILGGKLAGPASAGDVVLEIMEIGPIRADVILSAISSSADVTILSRPVILAQNNQEARILVGSERPFVQVFRALPTDNAVRDQVVQYRDVGTSLTIRPTINHDGYVSLRVLQEVSTATSELQFGAPVISTREAATQLLVRDGQTVVIGGLIDRQRDRTRGGIPLLKNLPLIGWLFGSTSRADVQTELFVFITPHIIESDEDADRVREGIEQGTDLLKDRLPDQRSILPPRPDTLQEP